MASAIPVANTRNAAERSKSRRIGALLDLSRGEPPLSVMRRNIEKEPQKSVHPALASSRTRAQTSRIPQSPPTHKPSTEVEVRGPRPPLTHETQSWSTASRSGIPMAKPMTTVGGYDEPAKQPRNVLRRKQSTMLREPSNIYAQKQNRLDSRGNGSSSSVTNPQAPSHPINSFSDRSTAKSPGDIRNPQAVEDHRPTAQPTQVYPELDRYRDIVVPPSRDQLGRDALYRLATEDLPPPTPQFSGTSSHSLLSSFSASPSTRFSGSPGPGPYSRDTTPTSMCSQSPGLVAPMRLPAARLRQASPAETRPPVTRRRAGSVSNEGGSFSSDPQGLAAVREALTSSSSNSTVRAEEKKNSKAHRRPAPEPPNPPPRKSSQKFQKGRSVNEKQSPQNSSQQTMRSPSPGKLTKSARNRAPSVASSPQRRPTPPSRPSRDGTPDLYSQFGGPVPVIHSNLSSTSLTEKRQSGQLQSSSLPKTITLRSSQDRAGSARPSFSQESTQDPRAGILPSSQVSKNDVENTNNTSSSSMSTFKSKFPLFGRRTKAGTEVTRTEKKKDKIPRKGPAAGTGHEGYGRVGAVRRRSSATSTFQRGLPGLLSSSESLATTLSTDPFLLERMSPIIIAGGEVVENYNNGSHLIRTQSNQSIPWSRPSLDSRSFSAASPSTIEDNRQTLWPSPIISEATNSLRPSETSDAEDVMMNPTLAYRGAARGLELQDNAAFGIPKTINNRTPSVASMATTIHTDDSFPDIQREQSHVIPKVNEPAKKLTKRPKSPRKWTLFGRSQTSLSSKKEAESISATVQPSLNKPPAFYTIMDSPKQDDFDDSQEMNSVSNGTERRPVVDMQSDYGGRPSTGNDANQVIHARPGEEVTNIHSKKTGAIPQIWQLDTREEHRRAEQTPPQSSVGRPSRLPQVGRIPKVVASRPEQTSPKSFSRPFNRISVQLLPVPSTQPDQDSIAKGYSPPESVVPTSIETESPGEATPCSRSNKNQTGYDDLSMLGQPDREFLAFPPCDNSGAVESSESSLSDQPGYAAHIAQVPEPSAPFGEDEVWDEYNDLLQDVPPSPTSSCGDPFPLETYSSKLVNKLAKPLESPTIMTGATQDPRVSVATAKTTTTSSHYSQDMTVRIDTTFGVDSEPPVTPFSVSEFVSGYSDRNSNKVEPSQEPPAPLRDSSSSHGGENDKVSSKRSSEGSNRTSGSSRLSEETPLSQVNLRVGSMTVSKWLTFGHVLFSPIREELVNDDSSLKRQSILIIDGLGNDDWSFYAAETYPATNFFNLSPRAPLLQEHRKTPSFPLSPPNHHQIQFMSYADKFPFGPDSFTALVFRFPSAAPEAHYRKIISEAQRVIKPGGFIELSILDIDLNNVGGRTRRAVRRLKERVSAQNPDFNLSSAADLILRLLGQNGFVDIKTCRVGVPVASSITNASNKGAKKDERSLAEMMNDNTETGDANIAKMVSKVGRWWYNKCYEVPTGMSSSIWRDRALLAECEEWGTSLKLMVCHAKVPEAKGRVVSV
ncbi:hypothetical protein O1611_g4181 [Lasiodiplodia mahajangana]|uniref:Uncharacterized protein n=1 Tax=Lasiodiplodia mahajangana TaxID=1108764 RepID=A0ACC2JPN2_9PEZI|nr:hypothetical protein O1611_g4181 [Lasiodiplodia mahajangana]